MESRDSAISTPRRDPWPPRQSRGGGTPSRLEHPSFREIAPASGQRSAARCDRSVPEYPITGRSAHHHASEHPDRRRLEPRTAARVNPLAGHQIDFGAEDALHALLQSHQIEQVEALRTFEIKKNIYVGCVARLVAGDRAEQKQPPDSGSTQLRFVLPQHGDGLVAFNGLLRWTRFTEAPSSGRYRKHSPRSQGSSARTSLFWQAGLAKSHSKPSPSVRVQKVHHPGFKPNDRRIGNEFEQPSDPFAALLVAIEEFAQGDLEIDRGSPMRLVAQPLGGPTHRFVIAPSDQMGPGEHELEHISERIERAQPHCAVAR